ncbi:MAG TPA: hypothetical protein VGC97_10425 [Pyrinomonadaceae bacterium]|jgi:hypothetical protein
MKQKMEIIFEIEETVIVRQTAITWTAFCPACRALVEMALPQTIADLSGFTEREIFRLIEAGKVHFVEAERVFVCRNSLLRDSPPPDLNGET